MRKPTAKFQPLTTAQFLVLGMLHFSHQSATPAQIERLLEKRFPTLSLKALRRLIARSLQRLQREGVAVLVKDKAGEYWHCPQTLPVAARASLLLSKPPKEGQYHARKVQRQPEHQQRGAVAATQQTADGAGNAAADAGTIRGQGTVPDASGTGTGGATGKPVDGGGAVPSAPTEKTAAETVLAPAGSDAGAAPDSEHPHVETVAIKAPRKGGGA